MDEEVRTTTIDIERKEFLKLAFLKLYFSDDEKDSLSEKAALKIARVLIMGNDILHMGLGDIDMLIEDTLLYLIKNSVSEDEQDEFKATSVMSITQRGNAFFLLNGVIKVDEKNYTKTIEEIY
jgi:hypothetical protein